MNACRLHTPEIHPQCGRRRGVAVLVVMLLLSITLALSYASVRSQYTGLLIHQNAQRRGSARHAAMVGMTMAIKSMHQESWVGVDNAISGTLSENEGYTATFTTGDPSLSEGDPDYDDYPYRVTVVSTGYVIDSDNPARTSQYQIQAVLQLIPRALSDEPDGFEDLSNYSLCQSRSGHAYVNTPVRIAGAVRLRDRLHLGDHLDWSSAARWRYFDDLREAAEAGEPDYRPFNGPVTYPYSSQSSTTRSLLSGALGVEERDGSSSTEFAWPDDDLSQPYRLYPGGKEYSPQVVSVILDEVTLEPDPLDNPLGIFVRSGWLLIGHDVSIRGTLVTTGYFYSSVFIGGSDVELLPHDLPPVEGEDRAVRLPGIVSGDDLYLYGSADLTATGLLLAADDFEIYREDQDDIALSLSGTAVCKDIELWERTDWDHSEWWWDARWEEFDEQLGESDSIDDFPEWLEIHYGLKREPQIVIEAEAEPPRYHWYNPENPLFAVHPDDDGLRWNLIRWNENP